MIQTYFLLALKNLRHRGTRSWLTIVGVLIGIAAVVSLISLGNGLQTAVTGQFGSLDPDMLTITNAETGFGPPGSTAVRKLTDHDVEILEQINGVNVVLPRLIRTVEVNFNDISQFKYVVSFPSEEEKIEVVYDSIDVGLKEGRLLSQDDRRKVILGNDFTDNSFDKEIRVNRGITINGENFEVVGIFEQASTFQINSAILMPEEDLKRVLDIEDEWDIIVVEVKDREEIDNIANKIKEEFRSDRNLKEGEEDFQVSTPQQALQSINTILSVIQIVIAGIAAVSLLVGGIGIANTMYTSVLERTREIGIMKAIGAQNKDVLMIFLFESAIIGFVGGLIGAAIGASFAFFVALIVQGVYPGLAFSINLSLPLVLGALAFSFFLGGISGIFPAYQASKLKPIEALRK